MLFILKFCSTQKVTNVTYVEMCIHIKFIDRQSAISKRLSTSNKRNIINVNGTAVKTNIKENDNCNPFKKIKNYRPICPK